MAATPPSSGLTILGVVTVLLIVLVASASRAASADLWVYGLAALLLVALAGAVVRAGQGRH